MKLSEVSKFCEGASLSEVFELKLKLMDLMEAKKLSNTNAVSVLKVLDEYIELKKLFEIG